MTSLNNGGAEQSRKFTYYMFTPPYDMQSQVKLTVTIPPIEIFTFNHKESNSGYVNMEC